MVEQANTRAHLKENLVLGAAYSSFFVLVFMLSAYLTFPYDRLRDLITASASSSVAGTTQHLQIGELIPLGFSGVRLSDVEFVREPPVATDASTVVRVSELSLRVSLWGLLFGQKKADVDAKIGRGTLSAAYTQSTGVQTIQADLVAVDVAELGLGSFVGLPLKGKASGKVDLTLPTEVPKSTGTVKLEIKGLHIGDGKAKVKVPAMAGTGLTLDEIDAGKLELGVQVQDGIATLTRLTTDGRDLKLSGKGTIRLVDPIKRSRPDLNVDLTFSDAYKSKSDRAKAMFDIIGLRPEWQRATTPDGTMHVHVGGTMQAIRGGPAR
jgi:type II secretion system protein N